jgi:hypothetical protein
VQTGREFGGHWSHSADINVHVVELGIESKADDYEDGGENHIENDSFWCTVEIHEEF